MSRRSIETTQHLFVETDKVGKVLQLAAVKPAKLQTAVLLQFFLIS